MTRTRAELLIDYAARAELLEQSARRLLATVGEANEEEAVAACIDDLRGATDAFTATRVELAEALALERAVQAQPPPEPEPTVAFEVQSVAEEPEADAPTGFEITP